MTTETASQAIPKSDWDSVCEAVELFVMAFALAWNALTFPITQEASRVSFTPLDKRRSWELGGTGSLAGLFTRIVYNHSHVLK